MFRLAAWNCRMGVDRKRAAFDRIQADVLVVPECSSSPALARELGVSFAWRGRYPSKGLGVFGLNGWSVVAMQEETALPWLLPLRLLDTSGEEAALLLALWTVTGDGRPSYTAQVAAAVREWDRELRDRRTILAGDFNCSGQTRKPGAHLANVESLKRLGTVSAYHTFFQRNHGDEPAMTLRWGKDATGFHCDFVFASAAMSPSITNVEVGTFEEWVESGLSDHCPVSVDFRWP
jgi:hypothetical protein